MKMNPIPLVAFVALGAMADLSSGVKAEPPEVILKVYSREFIYFTDQIESISGSVPSETQTTPEANQPAVSGFSVSLKAWAVGIQDTPEAKLQFQGTTYVIPARKIMVPGRRPDGNGVFVESALDPNGSGNFEVLLVVNWSAEGFEYPSLDQSSLPKGIETSGTSSRSSTKDNRKELMLTVFFRNETGQPFILKPEHFKNLPETKDWPLIEIPPTHPQA